MKPQSKAPQFRQQGFTLVELMVVVAIAGILSSIALPQVSLVLRKSKRSEVQVQGVLIFSAMRDYMSNHEKLPVVSGSGTALTADWNPPLPTTGIKKPFLTGQPGWGEIMYAPDGYLYGHYKVVGETAASGSGFPTITLLVSTDLDGDNVAAVFTQIYEFRGGLWMTTDEDTTGDDW